MLRQREIERLLGVRKVVQERITWHSRPNTTNIEHFRVRIFSTGGDFFYFMGQYNTDLHEVRSLVLTYQGEPFVRIDKHRNHRNPQERGGEIFIDWHKHEWDEIYRDDIARDVSHEFNDAMSRDDFITQFMRENNMDFTQEIKDQRTLINWNE